MAVITDAMPSVGNAPLEDPQEPWRDAAIDGRLSSLDTHCYNSAMTCFVSITRLRVRSFRFMPGFVLQTVSTLRQVKRADGFLKGSLLPDRQWTFWTMTVWRDAAAMRAYMKVGSHLKAMPKLMDWCDEASVVHWEQENAEAPSWTTADRRMRAEGRPSKVRWPSDRHRTLDYREPRVSRAAPIAARQVPAGDRPLLSTKFGS